MNEGHGPEHEQPAPEVLAQFQHYLRFVSLDPAKNRARFYLLSWQVSLAGDMALVCTWGRLGTQGRTRVVFVLDRAEAEQHLAHLIRRRLKRGYQVSEWQ